MKNLFDLAGIEVKKVKKESARQFSFDFIYTDSTGVGLCCIAVQAGLKYGIQSGFKGCLRQDKYSGRHRVIFVDNDYKKYDHQKHLDSVRKHKPKYCTTRDLMTKEQCKKDDIRYYSFDEILDQAYELNEYAENVMLIPKYDCLDKIPNDFMLGYSIPTSHGGTPLLIEMFSGWRTHLLGGSWKRQLDLILEYDFIVSADNNYVSQISRYGSFVYPDGAVGKLRDIGLNPPNHLHVATVISFGSIAEKLNELFGGNK
jgi:hypothetical protein